MDDDMSSVAEWENMEYYVRILELKCQLWDEHEQLWHDLDFQVKPIIYI